MKHFRFPRFTFFLFLVIVLFTNNSDVFSQLLWQPVFSDNFDRPNGPLQSPWQLMEDTLYIQAQKIYAKVNKYGCERFTTQSDSAQTVQLRADFNFANDMTGKFDFYLMGSYIFGVGVGYSARITSTSLELYTVTPESRLFKKTVSLQVNSTYTVIMKVEALNETVTATLQGPGIETVSISATSPKRYFNTFALGIDNYNHPDSVKTIDNIVFEKDITVGANESLPILTSEYFLSQNYPNPFNPLTTIKYSVPERVHTVLKVFDNLGCVVETLVNEEKLPGKYYVKFDGSSLSSGVYYYRFNAGNFTETKKLLLIK